MVFAAFISQMDVFVYQGGPGVPILPLLMALAADCPCLVDGEFGELVKEPGFESRLSLLENAPTIEGLSEAIRLCLANRHRPRHPGGFSWEGMAQGIVQVFQQCHGVRQHHRAPRAS